MAAGLFVLALLVRLAYLAQIRAMPLFERPAFDGRRYLEWAADIAAGDWLGKGVFFQAPLYPYFLGTLESLFGRDLILFRVVQTAMGSASCVFLWWAGRTLFSRWVGFSCGLFLALYGPAVFYDGLIQKASLDLFLVSLLIALLVRALEIPGRGSFLAIGITLGLFGLTRENALLLIPILLAWPWFGLPRLATRERAVSTALITAGLVLVLLPVGLRNLFVGGEFALSTSQFGHNFYIGNHAGADGTYQPMSPGWGNQELEQQGVRRLAERALGRELRPGEVSAYWSDQAFDWIRAHPFEWVKLLGRKWMLVWNQRELEDADDYYLYQEWSSVLRVLGVLGRFGLLVPLAALGAVLTASRWRELVVFHALVLCLAASVAVFYVFGRYRVCLVPPLVLFAAAGAVQAVRLVRSAELARVGGALAFAAVVVVLVHLPILDRPIPSPAGCSNLADAFDQAGRKEEARAIYQRALALAGSSPMIRYNLARLLAEAGELAEAEKHLRQVLAVAPEFAEAHNNLGIVLARQGRGDEGLAEFRRAVEAEPDLFDARVNLGTALARRARFEEALVQLRKAVELDPESDGARSALSAVQRALGLPER